jgi:hypothetical protein
MLLIGQEGPSSGLSKKGKLSKGSWEVGLSSGQVGVSWSDGHGMASNNARTGLTKVDRSEGRSKIRH